MLVAVLEHLFAEATVLGGESQNFLIVIGRTQFLGQDMADGASAAAELATYVDDKFIHMFRVLGG